MAPLVLSIKPPYVDQIFNGSKRVELRRRFSLQAHSQRAFVWRSGAEGCLYGVLSLGAVWYATPKELWPRVRPVAGLDEEAFFRYFDGARRAWAIALDGGSRFRTAPRLETLRNYGCGFTVPQSWRWARPAELSLLETLPLDPVFETR